MTKKSNILHSLSHNSRNQKFIWLFILVGAMVALVYSTAGFALASSGNSYPESGIAASSTTMTVKKSLTTTCPAQITAYWKLDETSGTIYDDAYDGQEGQCVSGSCPTPVTGQVNGAQAFNLDKINVAADEAFNWGPNDSFSIEFWAKSTSDQTCNNTQVVLGRDNGGGGRSWIGCVNTGKVRFQLRDNSDSGLTLDSTTAINDGNWHHVVGVRNGATDTNHIYVDGTHVVSDTFNYTAGFGSDTAPLNIGWLNHESLGPDFYFIGAVDEVAVYNQALSASEITQHYNSGVSGEAYCSFADAPPAITSDPVTEATMGESYSYKVKAKGQPSPSFAIDTTPATGMSIDTYGYISWTPPVTDTVAVTVTATNSQGSDTQTFSINVVEPVLEAPQITSFPNTAAIIGQLYTYDVEATGSPTPTFILTTTAPGDISIDSNSGYISWTPPVTGTFPVTVTAQNTEGEDLQNFSIEVSEPPPVAPEITSIAKTIATKNELYTYDVEATGEPAPTFTLTTTAPGDISIDANSGYISWTPLVTGTFPVTVTAQNTAGTDTQAFFIDVFNKGTLLPTCPIETSAYWKLDETSGPPYKDDFSNYDAECVNGNCPSAVTGQVNGALSFDGQNTAVNAPADAAFNWDQDDSFSIEFWMKGIDGQTCSSGTAVIVGSDNQSGMRSWLGCTNDKARFQLRDDNGNGTVLIGPTINDGSWHHIAGVRDGSTNTNYLYVDGTDVVSDTFTYTAGFSSGINPFNIGWLNHETLGPEFYFEGTIDEVAVYNIALSNTEVQNHYTYTVNGAPYCTTKIAPEIFSTPVTEVTVDELYTYDVDTRGFPTPTFALDVAPSGMEIDTNTGVITWTPTSIGIFTTTVEVSNTAGTDSQTFAINVNPPTYTVTISTIGEGTVTIEPDQESYAEGETITLTATAAPGWGFQQWSGDIAGSGNPRIVSVTSDLSVTAVFVTAAEMEATKTDALLVDENGNNIADPGDTIQYTITVSNIGDMDATGIVLADTPDANTTLLAGSVTPSQGTVTSGNGPGDSTVNVDIGTIAGGGSATVVFEVKINDSLPDNVITIANQGVVSGSNFASSNTDDPDTVAPSDATETAVGEAVNKIYLPFITGNG